MTEVGRVPDVADEIWAKVFSYLSLNDRQSVRLSCSRFYEICNCVRLQRGEQMVIRGQRDLEAAIWWLSGSGRRTLNFRLNRICVGDWHALNERLLARHGAKVGALAFDQLGCEPLAPRTDVIASAVRSCPHLRELILVFAQSTNSDCYRQLTADFTSLQAAGVVRPTVDAFSLRIPDSDEPDAFRLTNGDFLRMFDVFPGVTKLVLSLPIDDDFESTGNLADPALSETFAFSCLYYQLMKMRGQLVKLRLLIEEGLSPKSLLRLGDIDGLRDLSLDWTHPWDDSLANPFARLKHLTHFEWLIEEPDGIVYSELVVLLLTTATALRSLTVRTKRMFHLSQECLRALVASRLTNLIFGLSTFDLCEANVYVGLDHTDGHATRPLFEGMAPNRTLRQLNVSPRYNDSLLTFAHYFRALCNFVCADMETRMLSNIFRLRDLRRLVLFNCTEYPYRHCMRVYFSALKQWRWGPERPSYRQLRRLTHLRIVEERSLDLSLFLLGWRAFPALKSLKIEINRLEADPRLAIDADALLRPIQKLAQLQSLDIRCQIEWTFARCCQLLEALPKLRSVVLSVPNLAHMFLDEEYERLFGLRPSLRSICVIMPPVRSAMPTYESENLFSTHVYYLRDLITGGVEKRTKENRAYSAGVEVYFEKSPPDSAPNATGLSAPVPQCCRMV